MESRRWVLLSLFLLLLLPIISMAARVQKLSSSTDCVYTIFIRTGSIFKGGTDSIVNVTLLDSAGNGLAISNLEAWGGLMEEGWNYFERGNLDIFSGRGPCLDVAPCTLVLGMDGSGAHPGWYCNYVEVTATGPHLGCSQTLFTVEQWLGPDVINPKLVYTVDLCTRNGTEGHRENVLRSPVEEDS